MSAVRAWLRLLAMTLVTLVAVAAAALTWPLGWLTGRRGRLGLVAITHVTQFWARALLLVLGVRVDAPGRPPPGRWMLVSNHLSYLDILVIASRLRCRFVAKSEVAGWPFVGFISKAGRTLFVDRGRKRDVLDAGQRIRDTLDAGVTVAFFPEGTSTRGERVEPFHAGLLEPAAKGGIDCLPVALGYETPHDPDGPGWTVCWWADMTFAPHAWQLMKLRRIDATIRWAEQPVHHEDRKVLAKQLHDEVSRLFVPVRQDPEPADNPWAEACAVANDAAGTRAEG
jgi:1-acyl-sn-glycerol-3-phosphate acyltransferase